MAAAPEPAEDTSPPESEPSEAESVDEQPAGSEPAVSVTHAPGPAVELASPGPAASGPPRAGGPPGASGPPGRNGPPPGGPRATNPPGQAASTQPPLADGPAASASSDLSIEDWTPKKGKAGIYAVIGLVGFVAVLLLVFVINATSENELKKEVEAKQIDPSLLEDDAQPEIPTITVAAESTPPGAHFVVNSVPAQREGGALVLRQGMTNEVTAVMSGHRPVRKMVEGTESASPIRFELEPLDETKTASLAIVTEPREARIWLNGKDMGVTPHTLNDLPTGVEHHVYLEKTGRFGYSGFIQLVPGSENAIKTELPREDSARKNYVEVRYHAVPRGAVVYGKDGIMGSTPFMKNTTRPGFVEIEFEDPDHRSMKRKIALERMGTIELRPFLEPMKRESGTVDVEVSEKDAILYIGNSEYGVEPVKKLKLKEGKHKVVVEHLGQRLRGIIEVYPNEHATWVINVEGDRLNPQRVQN